jgi:hypothetical protein
MAEPGNLAIERHFGSWGLTSLSAELPFSRSSTACQAGQPSYPKPVQDVRAAVQFVKYKANDLKVDPQRVANQAFSQRIHTITNRPVRGSELE